MTRILVRTVGESARRSGLDQRVATGMTLLTDDGLEAAHLASSVRPQPVQAAAEATQKPAAQRLEELSGLLAPGAIAQAEYDARRLAIIDQV